MAETGSKVKDSALTDLKGSGSIKRFC